MSNLLIGQRSGLDRGHSTRIPRLQRPSRSIYVCYKNPSTSPHLLSSPIQQEYHQDKAKAGSKYIVNISLKLLDMKVSIKCLILSMTIPRKQYVHLHFLRDPAKNPSSSKEGHWYATLFPSFTHKLRHNCANRGHWKGENCTGSRAYKFWYAN